MTQRINAGAANNIRRRAFGQMERLAAYAELKSKVNKSLLPESIFTHMITNGMQRIKDADERDIIIKQITEAAFSDVGYVLDICCWVTL